MLRLLITNISYIFPRFVIKLKASTSSVLEVLCPTGCLTGTGPGSRHSQTVPPPLA